MNYYQLDFDIDIVKDLPKYNKEGPLMTNVGFNVYAVKLKDLAKLKIDQLYEAFCYYYFNALVSKISIP